VFLFARLHLRRWPASCEDKQEATMTVDRGRRKINQCQKQQ